MEEDPNYWRYFRIDGHRPTRGGDSLFSVKIHHGGRFYSNRGANRQYMGATGVVFVDGVVTKNISVRSFNTWANDLGYCRGPIMYWFRIPGSEAGSGYLPVATDDDAVDMLQFIPSRDRTLNVYFVCLSLRREFQEWELEQLDEDVDHSLYFADTIKDLPLSSIGEEDLHLHLDATDVGDVNPSSQSFMTEAPTITRRRSGWRMPNVGISIREPNETQGSAASIQTSVHTSKGKGKQKVDYGPSSKAKKKVGRPYKPVTRRYPTRGNGECSQPVGEEEVGSETSDSDDPNYDGLVNSDYELFDEEDEVFFQMNVDGDPSHVAEYNEMGFEGNISDGDGSDQSDEFPSFHGSDSDGEDVGPFMVKGKKRFSEWEEFNPKIDMKDPKFKLGMVFPNSMVFKNAVRKHAVLTRKELRFAKNTKQKVKVICKTSPGCPFWLYASSTDEDTTSLMIKVYKPKHKCSSIEGRVYHCHTPFIANEYMDQFMADPKWSREGIQNAVTRDFGMDIGYQMCYRAKKRATKIAQGSYEDQYNLLESYAHELKKRNPSTTVWIQTEFDGEIPRFKRIYICFEELKKGWRYGCRPIIGLDGCHLKGVHKGQLLSAVGIDGNNGMYLIAYAIVELECRDSWTWFLTSLREDLQIYASVHYAFISDKQKGLEQAIKDLFPYAEHRHCVRHLHNNFKGDGHSGLALKQLLWAVARSNTMTQFNKAMENLQNASYNAWKWCVDRPASHWSRSHFKEQIKCDILLNNHNESFNKSVIEARKKSIIPCLEDIRTAAMVRLNNRRNSAARWRSKVGPRIEKLIRKNATWSYEYIALESSTMRFEVQGRGAACQSGVISQHSVNLDTQTCTCRRWDLSGLPCAHAIAAIYSKGWSPDDFVSQWYTLKKYMEAYEAVINPIAGVEEWDIKERSIAPPLYRRQPGRPKTKRTKEPGEEPPTAGNVTLPKSYYSQIKCGECGKKEHNRRTCASRNQGVNQGPNQDQANLEVAQQQVEHQAPQVPADPNRGEEYVEAENALEDL